MSPAWTCAGADAPAFILGRYNSGGGRRPGGRPPPPDFRFTKKFARRGTAASPGAPPLPPRFFFQKSPGAQTAASTAPTISSTTATIRRLVLGLGHDPDERLGPRLGDQRRPCPFSFASPATIAACRRAGPAAPAPHRSARCAAPCGTVSKLRARRLAGWPVRTISARNCSPAISPSPVSRVIGHHDMARLLAPEVQAVGAHRLDHVAVAHGRAVQPDPAVCQIPLQPEVRHHGRGQRPALQPPLLGPAPGEKAP